MFISPAYRAIGQSLWYPGFHTVEILFCWSILRLEVSSVLVI